MRFWTIEWPLFLEWAFHDPLLFSTHLSYSLSPPLSSPSPSLFLLPPSLPFLSFPLSISPSYLFYKQLHMFANRQDSPLFHEFKQ